MLTELARVSLGLIYGIEKMSEALKNRIDFGLLNPLPVFLRDEWRWPRERTWQGIPMKLGTPAGGHNSVRGAVHHPEGWPTHTRLTDDQKRGRSKSPQPTAAVFLFPFPCPRSVLAANVFQLALPHFLPLIPKIHPTPSSKTGPHPGISNQGGETGADILGRFYQKRLNRF